MSLTILFVWLFGLGNHHTLFQNTFTSTWIISTILFQFLFFGLYKGFKMKEDLGKVVEMPKFESVGSELSGFVTDGISEIEAVFIFILLIPVIIAFIINFAVFFWAAILIFIAVFYWIFYRAIKFSFKQSLVCKGNIVKSVLYSLVFTIIYTSWFFTIILGVHYWK